MKEHVIKQIKPGSIADELGLCQGDRLLTVNGHVIEDMFDYYYYCNEKKLFLVVQKEQGEEWELEIEKEEEEPLGIEFASELMDEYRSCRNQCVFCFIDQMPPGMRKTLYFKDDDARLSFLQGNYITLTNLSEQEMERILFYKLSPINISVHTTNPLLRCEMLHNRFAGDVTEKIARLAKGNIEMNGQIVLCKGYNDGEELDRTIQDLSQWIPQMKSLSVVPVGLTKFREGLVSLEEFQKEDAKKVLTQIHKWQDRLLERYQTRFVFASDEWYRKAEETIPEESHYEGYHQIENGVGMVRSFLEEAKECLSQKKGDRRAFRVSLATGTLAAPILEETLAGIYKKFPNIEGIVYPVVNHFFGEQITVAGLLTGKDLIEQLSGRDLGEILFLPQVLLRRGEQTLLDDITVSELESTLQIRIGIVQSDGTSFVDTIVNWKEEKR